jgi:creatinine amidohydrolase
MRNQDTSFPKIVVASWYTNISPELMSRIFDQVEFPGWELEHAAITETSLMMYFAPELVRRDQIIGEGLETYPPYQCFPPSRTLLPESGALYGALSSSPEKGRLIAEDVVKNFITLLSKEFTKEA